MAEKVGVHITAMSRAVDDKWIDTPRGIHPLKRSFGGAYKDKETGEEPTSWERIKQAYLDLIAAEDQTSPLSDEDLMEKLNQAGFPVKRRTVTKYRNMLKNSSSRQRKQWVG